MELKDIVCSLEHAKRLKELGVKQDSLFYWSIDGEDSQIIMPMKIDNITVEISSKEKCSAFIASELDYCLNKNLIQNKKINDRYHEYINIELGFHWMRLAGFSPGHNDGDTIYQPVENNNIDNRASMLIYLIENGLIEAPK
jgi:hypothetical protein